MCWVDRPQSKGTWLLGCALWEIQWIRLDSSVPSYHNPGRSPGHPQGYCLSACVFHCNPTQRCCGRLTCRWSPVEDSEKPPSPLHTTSAYSHPADPSENKLCPPLKWSSNWQPMTWFAQCIDSLRQVLSLCAVELEWYNLRLAKVSSCHRWDANPCWRTGHPPALSSLAVSTHVRTTLASRLT